MKKPKALRLADALETLPPLEREAAAQLRILHEVNQELLEAFKLIVEVGDRAATEISREAIAKATGEQA